MLILDWRQIVLYHYAGLAIMVNIGLIFLHHTRWQVDVHTQAKEWLTHAWKCCHNVKNAHQLGRNTAQYYTKLYAVNSGLLPILHILCLSFLRSWPLNSKFRWQRTLWPSSCCWITDCSAIAANTWKQKIRTFVSSGEKKAPKVPKVPRVRHQRRRRVGLTIGSGGASSAPQLGLGQNPSQKCIWCIVWLPERHSSQ